MRGGGVCKVVCARWWCVQGGEPPNPSLLPPSSFTAPIRSSQLALAAVAKKLERVGRSISDLPEHEVNHECEELLLKQAEQQWDVREDKAPKESLLKKASRCWPIPSRPFETPPRPTTSRYYPPPPHHHQVLPHSTPPHPTPPHPTRLHPTPPRYTPLHSIPPYLTPSQPIPSHPIPSHTFPSHPSPPHPATINNHPIISGTTPSR